jgi:hypothetical protein
MSDSSTPEEEKEESTLIDSRLEKEMSKMKSTSDEVNEQPIYQSLSCCRFIEDFDYFGISNLGYIDVILSTECIFAEVDQLWSCFESSLNLICYWLVKLHFFCQKETITKNVE